MTPPHGCHPHSQLYQEGNYGKGAWSQSAPTGVSELGLRTKRPRASGPASPKAKAARHGSVTDRPTSRAAAPVPQPPTLEATHTPVHLLARRRLAQSLNFPRAWAAALPSTAPHAPSTTLTLDVKPWLPSSRTQLPRYTATLDKRSGHSAPATWTPATSARAAAAQSPVKGGGYGASTGNEWTSALQALTRPLALPARVQPEHVAVDPLVLAPAEVLWLSLQLGVLCVWDGWDGWAGGETPLPLPQLARALRGIGGDTRQEALYAACRRLGWVPRPGVSFAGQWTVYPDGPATGHAPYTLLLRSPPTLTWRSATGHLRVATSVRKQLLLVEAAAMPPVEEEGGEGQAGECQPLLCLGLRGCHVDLQHTSKRRRDMGLLLQQWLRGDVQGGRAVAPVRRARETKAPGHGAHRAIETFAAADWTVPGAPDLQSYTLCAGQRQPSTAEHTAVVTTTAGCVSEAEDSPQLSATSTPWLQTYSVWTLRHAAS